MHNPDLPVEVILTIFRLSVHTAPNWSSETSTNAANDSTPTDAGEVGHLDTDVEYPDNILRSGITTHPTNPFTPLTLSHVCQSWRALSFGAPELWTRIYVTNGATDAHQILQIYLKNSGSMLLDLVFRDSREEDSTHGKRIGRMIELAAAERARWRSLKIRFRYIPLPSVGSITSLIVPDSTQLPSPIPNLEVLAFSFGSFESESDDDFDKEWVKIITRAPRLCELQMWATMDEVPSFLASLPHKQITILTLPMVYFFPNSTLLQTMHAFTRLTSLAISLDSSFMSDFEADFAADLQSQPLASGVVQVPSLRELYLVEREGEHLARVLSHLRFPGLTELRVHWRSEGGGELERYAALEGLLARSGCALRRFALLDEVADAGIVERLVNGILAHRAMEGLLDLSVGSVVGVDLLESLVARRPVVPARTELEAGDVQPGTGNAPKKELGTILPALQTLELGYLGAGTAATLVEVVASRTSLECTTSMEQNTVARLAFVKAGFMHEDDLCPARRLWDERGVEAAGPVERIFRVVGSSKRARMLKEEMMFRDFSMVQTWISDLIH